MALHVYRRVLAAGSGLLLAVVGLVASTTPAVAATCSGVRGDVNGDGYAEVAVGEPGNDVRRGGSTSSTANRPVWSPKPPAPHATTSGSPRVRPGCRGRPATTATSAWRSPSVT